MNLLAKIKKNWLILALLGIFAVGILLRTYHFSDWLRVNMDQARDTNLVENMIQEKIWPKLGPKAGGTEFKLGPAFYDFQLISAKLFGANFPAVAYPDLLFSLLSIPLFFLLAKIFFNKSISLTLTWLFAISYFVIKYSRFAWNPNSTPFFVMLFLYAIYQIGTTKNKKQLSWALMAGVAMGIGVQLHTTLLVIMPITAVLFAYYLYKNKTLAGLCVVAVFVGAMLVNIPQLNTEIKTNGSNVRAFFVGAENKNSRNTNILDNLALNATCHIRANFGIVASYSREEECDYGDVLRSASKSDGYLTIFYLLGATIFSLGGYFLAYRELKKETKKDKQFFLKLILSYTLLVFLFFIIVATELSMRFFLIVEFVPFLLLGFWLKFLAEKNKKLLLIIVVILCSFFSLHKDYSVFRDLQFGGREINGQFEYITLGEVNFITDYIKQNNTGRNVAYLDAQAGYLFKAFKALRLVANKKGLELIELNKTVNLVSGDKLFYLKNSSDKCEFPDNLTLKYTSTSCVTYRQFSVFNLSVK